VAHSALRAQRTAPTPAACNNNSTATRTTTTRNNNNKDNTAGNKPRCWLRTASRCECQKPGSPLGLLLPPGVVLRMLWVRVVGHDAFVAFVPPRLLRPRKQQSQRQPRQQSFGHRNPTTLATTRGTPKAISSCSTKDSVPSK
jgi:hypothetical protein